MDTQIKLKQGPINVALYGVILGTYLICGCGPETRAIQIELVAKGSCFPATSFNIECVNSLRANLVEDGKNIRSECTVLTGYLQLQELVGHKGQKFILEDLPARQKAKIELQGFHTFGDIDPCTTLTNERLVFWGSSAEVDLSNKDLDRIIVSVECRPECDCRGIGVFPTCPSDFSYGVCGPPTLYTCRQRACQSDIDCFDGQMACFDKTVCVPKAPQSMGADCGNDSDCLSGVCVHHTANDATKVIDEHYCAETCPAADGSAVVCPSGMSCKRLGNGYFNRVSQDGL